MIIDRLVTLLDFQVDSKTLNKYKRDLKKTERLLSTIAREAKRSFKETGAAVRNATGPTQKFAKETAALKAAFRSNASASRNFYRKNRQDVLKARAALLLKRKAMLQYRQAVRLATVSTVAFGKASFKAFGTVTRRLNRVASSLIRFRNLFGITMAGLIGFSALNAIVGEGRTVELRRMMITRFSQEGEDPLKTEKQLTQLALDTGLTTGQVTDSFIDMRQRGMQPFGDDGDEMNGMLRALIDTNSAYGGSAEDLKLELLQLGQAWGKNKLQGQDLRILLEKRLPMLKALARVVGDVNRTEEQNIRTVYKMVEAGEISRDVLKESILLMGTEARGAAKQYAGTLDGIINKLVDYKEIFFRMVNDSGFFAAFKAKLEQINSELSRMYRTGELKEYAKALSDWLIDKLETLWSWIKANIEAFKRGDHIFQRVGKFFKDWGITLGTIVKIGLVVWLAPLLTLMLQLVVVIGLWIAALKKLSVVSKLFAGSGIIGFFKTKLGIISLIITAVVWLYYNWQWLWEKLKQIGAWLVNTFIGAWNSVKNTFISLWEWISSTFIEMWESLKQSMSDFADWLTDVFVSAWNAVLEAINAVGKATDSVLRKTGLPQVGEFLGESAAAAVIAAKDVGNYFNNLFGGEDATDPTLLNTALSGSPTISANGPAQTTPAQKTIDNGSTFNVKIDVNGAESDKEEIANRVVQGIRDSAKAMQRNATTTVTY